MEGRAAAGAASVPAPETRSPWWPRFTVGARSGSRAFLAVHDTDPPLVSEPLASRVCSAPGADVAPLFRTAQRLGQGVSGLGLMWPDPHLDRARKNRAGFAGSCLMKVTRPLSEFRKLHRSLLRLQLTGCFRHVPAGGVFEPVAPFDGGVFHVVEAAPWPRRRMASRRARLEPELSTVIVLDGDHVLGRRSSSAWGNTPTPRAETRWPAASRLSRSFKVRRTTDLRSCRHDRRPAVPMLECVARNQAKRTRAQVRGILVRRLAHDVPSR